MVRWGYAPRHSRVRPGKHRVHCVDAAAGLDAALDVRVEPGETVEANFRIVWLVNELEAPYRRIRLREWRGRDGRSFLELGVSSTSESRLRYRPTS